MSSRGIVSAKSEIPRNRHHWVIGMLSHLAGSGSVTGFGSPKVTKNAWWYSWSAKVVAGEGANGTVRIPHTIEIALGGRFGNNLVVTLCCKLSQSAPAFAPFPLPQRDFEPDNCGKYWII